MKIERLKYRIQSLHLFSAIGTQTSDPLVKRIFSWEDWIGPESPTVEEIGHYQQSLRELVISNEKLPQWEKAVHLVLEHVTQLVPYIQGEDPWYGPNSAAWNAAWTEPPRVWRRLQNLREWSHEEEIEVLS